MAFLTKRTLPVRVFTLEMVAGFWPDCSACAMKHPAPPVSPFRPKDLAETMLLPPAAEASTRSDASFHAELVAGTQPQLDAETRPLLRQRLQVASLVLSGAIALFFLRNLFLPDAPQVWLQALVAGLLAMCCYWLTRAEQASLQTLRKVELLVFGSTSAYLAAYQYAYVLEKTQEGDPVFALAAIKSNVMYVFGVIMLYGTFIPNTWKRTAAVVFPMAMVPLLMMVVLQVRFPAVRQLGRSVGTFEQVSDHVIILLFGATAATIGANTMSRLRQVAFRARQLGQYRLKEKLGGGGMGEVYLAEHQLLKRPCAIKLIRPGAKVDPAAVARFEREVRATAKLSHWNTIDIFDYGRTDDGTFYYVMEYLPGLSLADIVQRYGPLDPARAVHLLRQTCQALQEAHKIGLVHRDIKPANIFAAHRGGVHDVAKLLDFGLVYPIASAHTETESAPDSGFSGTPLFMSPEQGSPTAALDARSDIYSLGATAYFILTGRPPFPGQNVVKVLMAHARDEVPPPRSLNPLIPPDLEAIVLRCLAKDPADRFPDVAALEEALGNCSMASQWTEAAAADWWRMSEETSLLGDERGAVAVSPAVATPG